MRDLRTSSLFVLAVAALLVAIGCGGGDSQAGNSGAATDTETAPRVGGHIGDLAPDFTLPDLSGQMVSLSSYRGNVVLVDFWATWCGPCRMVMPHLEEIHRTYGDKGVTILALSTDRNAQKVVPPFIEQGKFTFRVLYADAAVTDAFSGVRSLPTTFVIDANGKITQKMIGAHPKQTYLDEIAKLKPELF